MRFRPQTRPMTTLVGLLVGAVLAAACADTTPAPAKADASGDAHFAAADPPTALRKGPGLWFSVDEAKGTLSLRRGDVAVLSLGGKDGALAVRSSLEKVKFNFGSFLFDDSGEPPWTAVASLKRVGAASDLALFAALDASGMPLGQLELTVPTADRARLQFLPAGTTNRALIAWDCAAGEHFVGFGGQSFDVDHRGQRLDLWVSEDGIGKLPGQEPPQLWFVNGKRNQTHTPMPLYVSSRNYGVVVRSEHRVLADVCMADPGQVQWEDQGGSLDVTWYVASGPQEVNTAIAQDLGTPEMLPGFALMPWIDAIYGPDNVLRVAQKLKDLKIPVTAVWSEDWRGGTKTGSDYTLDEDWHSDPKVYPQIDKLADKLHALGFKFFTYNNTFITQGADIWDEATTKGYTIHKPDGSVYAFTGGKFEPATLLDLDNPEAVAWARGVYASGLQEGADGWMADFCEWLPTDAVLAGGKRGWDRHQLYPVQYQKLNAELLSDWQAKDGRERLTFVRSGWLGSQKLVQVMWGGDQQTDFSTGDGMPSVIPIGLGLGVAGFPYYGSDVAGYASAGTVATDKELFFRWTMLGALSPIMRTHHGKLAQENWQWEHDAETTAHFGRWAGLHARLFPYLWMLAQQPERAIMRPLAWQFPDFAPGWTRTDQYLLGNRIAVAPVMEKGATKRTVELPKGLWYPLLAGSPLDDPGMSGAPVQGGAPLAVEASITQLPAYVPPGTLLPLLPAGSDAKWADTLTRMSAPQAWKTAPVGVELWVWPGDGSTGAGLASWGTGDTAESYVWDGAQWSGACKTATFQDKPIVVSGGTVEVKGAGVLVLDDTGKLTIGGKNNPDAAVLVRVVCRGK